MYIGKALTKLWVLSWCQRFLIFQAVVKWKVPFQLLPTKLFGITSGGGPLTLGRKVPTKICHICHSIFGKPVHCPDSVHLWRQFEKRSSKWYESFLLVGWVWSENVPFSSGIPTWSLTGWFGIMKAPLDKFDSFFLSARKRLSCLQFYHLTTGLETWSYGDIFQCPNHTIMIRKLLITQWTSNLLLIDHFQILVKQVE